MELGLFFQIPVSNGQSVPERYRDTTDQVLVADKLGYHTAWFAESHFIQTFSTLASPFLFIASLAPTTNHIRLGTAAVIPSLHHPVRLIEEAGMLDVMTRGRLELALGRGGIVSHFQGYDEEVSDRTKKFEESLVLLKNAWGTHHLIAGESSNEFLHAITPKPVQKPHPPISIVANSQSTALFAASGKYHCIINSVVNNFNGDFFELSHCYHSASTHTNLSAVIPVLITGNKSMEEQARRSFSKYLGISPSNFNDYATSRVVIGSPGECVDQLQHISERANLKQLICWFNPGGLIPHEQVLESMTLLAQENNLSISKTTT